jgi:hypothetical protein
VLQSMVQRLSVTGSWQLCEGGTPCINGREAPHPQRVLLLSGVCPDPAQCQVHPPPTTCLRATIARPRAHTRAQVVRDGSNVQDALAAIKAGKGGRRR